MVTTEIGIVYSRPFSRPGNSMRWSATTDGKGFRAHVLGVLVGGCVGALAWPGAAGEGTILVSAWQATSFETFGPNLRQQLSDRFQYDLTQTNGDIDVLRRVRIDARSVGFVQRDLFVDRLRRDPENFDRLEFYGGIPACLVAVVRKGSPIQTYDDLVSPRRSRPVTLDIGPESGRVAETFAILRALDPALDNVDRKHFGGSRALSRVASGETDAALFIAYQPFRNDDLNALLEREEVDLVPVISRPIALAALNENAPYTLREITLADGGWLYGSRKYHTTCTSLGVVVSEKADVRLSEAVAHAMLQGNTSAERGFSIRESMTVVVAALGEVWRFLVDLTQFVSARVFGDVEHAAGVPASGGDARLRGIEAGNPTMARTLNRAEDASSSSGLFVRLLQKEKPTKGAND